MLSRGGWAFVFLRRIYTRITCPDYVGVTKKNWDKLKSPLDNLEICN
jgi:hypothetical protein